jgi:methionyl-tRNA formyltransferase
MKTLLFGDTPGISQLLHHLPYDVPVGIVGASIRPQYIEGLQALARMLCVPFLLQPKWKADSYDTFIHEVRALAPDLIWVNSYSMILRDDLLKCARLGGLNIHAGLLPKNRGCNPTQWAIIKGEHETGVSLHEIDSGLDTGPIIDQQRFAIFFEDSWLDVRKRSEQATDSLIIENLPKILSGNWSAVSQSNRNATVGKRRTPGDGLFSWSQPLVEIYNKVRALLPPLPPAFYKNEAGQRFSIEEHHSIWQLALLKHELCAGGGMQSKHVCLRPLRKSDADLLYEWITDRELVIHNSPFFPVTEADHEAWVERMMTKRSDVVIFVIEDLAFGQAIGTCQLVNINWIHRSAELQIRIGSPTLQGRGYGSEAVSLLCGFGFTDLNLHRIYLHVFASNHRAIRVYEKCGFEPEGVLKEAAYVDGSLLDVVLMAQLKISK